MDEKPRVTRSGNETRQRNFVAQMRCTDGERDTLTKAADRAGMSLGMFMRVKCFGTPGPRAVRTPPVDRVVMAQALARLGPVASNVNQIARQLNSGGDVPDYIAETLAEVRAIGADIRRAMGQRHV